MRRLLRQRLGLALALSMTVAGTATSVERARVLLIADPARAIELELVDAVRQTLAVGKGAAVDLSVVSLGEFIAAESVNRGRVRANLIVAVGTHATQHLAARQLETPMLSVLTPRTSFEEIARDRRRANGGADGAPLSAIYLDQSPARHFALVRLLFPGAQRVALVLGPTTATYAEELRAAAHAQGLIPLIESVTAEQNLVRVLDGVLPQADVMLAVIDPLVFNRTNAQSVLLTAYRHRVPLLGVSPSYVRAGAIAAVHTTPAQVGQQLGDLLVAFGRDQTQRLPAPQYPRELSVTVNEQVARSLQVPLPDPQRLEERLLATRGAP
jgi:hypothetical protein